MKLLIDGDILVYRCGFAAQRGRGDEVEAEPVSHALHNVREVVEAIQQALGSDDLTVYLSGSTNFRFDIATERPYKGNRFDAPKPVHYGAITQFLKDTYDHVVSDNQE